MSGKTRKTSAGLHTLVLTAVGAAAAAWVLLLPATAAADPRPVPPPTIPGVPGLPGPLAAPAQQAPQGLGLLRSTPDNGAVGSSFTLSGEGLPRNKSVDIVWATGKGAYILNASPENVEFSGRQLDPVSVVLAKGETDAAGRLSLKVKVPNDYGSIHDIYAVADGLQLAKGGFLVNRAYSVRPKPDGRVSAPVTWDELFECRPEDFTLRTMPARFGAVGDRHAGIDESPCSLEALLELSARQEAEGLGDAPWPPHYAKQAGEPPRVQPSRKKDGPKPSGRRVSTKPLVEIARAAKKEDALLGLERWKARHPEAAAHLEPADVLVDPMRGRSSTWTRVRVNLEHVPEPLRPEQEPLDPDYDPWGGFRLPAGVPRSHRDRERPRRARRGE